MRILVIDSATEACSVALFDASGLLAGNHAVLGRGHAERLVPMIADLPDRGRADAIRVNLGPGSFTGIRVGLAAAKALAFAWGADLAGYICHDLVAAMAASAHPCASIDVAMQGGHGEWFVARYDGAAEVLAPLRSLSPGDAAGWSDAPLVTGSMADALVAARGGGLAMPLWPDARSFGLLHGGRLDGARLIRPARPHYGRAPDAKLAAAKPGAPQA